MRASSESLEIERPPLLLSRGVSTESLEMEVCAEEYTLRVFSEESLVRDFSEESLVRVSR